MILIFFLQLQIISYPLPIKKLEIRDSSLTHLVIHNDGSNNDVKTVFKTLKRRSVGYHYYIDRKGKIYNFVDPIYKADHAGLSKWKNLSHWNDFSIGICLQGNNFRPYTKEQYSSLKKLIKNLTSRYPDLKTKKILGHSDIAYPRGRKKDPGKNFLWSKIQPLDKPLSPR